ncbi:hypothetical protein [Mucilaginibacter kameinonensis]|uniref:hypothetical protein n=1 Tax=Mucilaginibacter kameinonensis TaxID=452286 RepID=UPI000EF77370|nr:hypothetical protein [Mucilaginibacter kameinonensis]
MACNSLTLLARECGKNTKTGVRDEVYLIAYSDLAIISGSTEVYAVSSGGTISNINVASGKTFVKYGAVKDQNSIKSDYTYNDNGTYDIQKSLSFTLANIGSIAAKTAVENLFGNPVAALVKLKNGTWIGFGLNGQFQLKSVATEVSNSANGRVLTLSGSDVEEPQIVDPTIINSIVAL